MQYTKIKSKNLQFYSDFAINIPLQEFMKSSVNSILKMR